MLLSPTPPHAPPAAAQGRADPTCGLFDIIARLGVQRHGGRPRSVSWAARYVQALIDDEGFPKPLPLFDRGKLARDIRPRSRWQRAAVDAWFDEASGPAAAAAIDAAAARDAAAAMDARAANLGAPHLVLHQGGRDD